MIDEDVLAGLMEILAELTGDPAFAMPPPTPLLRDGVGLDSLGGTLLLLRVRARYGVDVADEDLNLDSLASIGTLAAFVEDRIHGR
jgi:acyl carrier protein